MPRRKASGRPPIAAAKKRTVRLVTYVTPAEDKHIRKHLRRGQTISDALRDGVLGSDHPAARTPAVEALPPPAPPEVASPPAAKAIASERATAPLASPPIPHVPSTVEPAPVPVPPENHQQPALIAEAKAALRNYRGTPIIAPLAYQIAERDPQLVLDVVREARAAGLSHRDLWFLLKERAGE